MTPEEPADIVVRPDLEQVLADQKTKELIEEFEQEARTRTITGFSGRVVTALAVAMTLLALYYSIAGAEIPFTRFVLIPSIRILGQTLTTPQIYTMLFLSGILVLTFLLYPPLARFRDRVTWLDLLLVAGAIAITVYIFVQFDQVIYRIANPNQWDFVFGVLAIFLVLEAGRRTTGWHLPVIGLLAIAYAYFADFMPGPFRGPPKDLDDIIANQYLGLDGMIGTPLQVAATFIILFTIYGAVLDRTGAGKFYVDLAFALAGRRPTGAARTVTFASFLLGTVSGSGVATTVTLGSITYPMLKRAGHDRESSGAILSAGGIGAVISPPVLGPAAVLGIAVGILLQTGLGLKISSLILTLGLGNLLLTLVVAGIVLWVLGLSLPITATYLVAVPTVIPALVTLGVPAPAAHMFVFYYAVLSEVSPPVAL